MSKVVEPLGGFEKSSEVTNLTPSTCFRGFFPTCIREGLFTAAYLGVAPVLRAHLLEAFPKTNEEVHRVVAAVASRRAARRSTLRGASPASIVASNSDSYDKCGKSGFWTC